MPPALNDLVGAVSVEGSYVVVAWPIRLERRRARVLGGIGGAATTLFGLGIVAVVFDPHADQSAAAGFAGFAALGLAVLVIGIVTWIRAPGVHAVRRAAFDRAADLVVTRQGPVPLGEVVAVQTGGHGAWRGGWRLSLVVRNGPPIEIFGSSVPAHQTDFATIARWLGDWLGVPARVG